MTKSTSETEKRYWEKTPEYKAEIRQKALEQSPKVAIAILAITSFVVTFAGFTNAYQTCSGEPDCLFESSTVEMQEFAGNYYQAVLDPFGQSYKIPVYLWWLYALGIIATYLHIAVFLINVYLSMKLLSVKLERGDFS